MNLKLFDAYCIINSRIVAVTLEYLGDIRVLVDACLKVLFYYELLNRSNRKNSFEVVSYPTNNSVLCSPLDRNFGVILHRTLWDGYMIQLC